MWAIGTNPSHFPPHAVDPGDLASFSSVRLQSSASEPGDIALWHAAELGEREVPSRRIIHLFSMGNSMEAPISTACRGARSP